MDNDTAGEYPQPLSRTGFVNCPIVTDGTASTTARLRAVNMSVTGTANWNENMVKFFIENTGASACTVQVVNTSDRTSSGIRANVGSAISLAAGGHQTSVLYPTQQYLEVTGTSGNSTVRIQLESRLRWQELGFAKDDPYYPTALWKPINEPTFAQLT